MIGAARRSRRGRLAQNAERTADEPERKIIFQRDVANLEKIREENRAARNIARIFRVLHHIVVVAQELRLDLLDVPLQILAVRIGSELRVDVRPDRRGVTREKIDVRQFTRRVFLHRRDRRRERSEIVNPRLVLNAIPDRVRVVFRRLDSIFDMRVDLRQLLLDLLLRQLAIVERFDPHLVDVFKPVRFRRLDSPIVVDERRDRALVLRHRLDSLFERLVLVPPAPEVVPRKDRIDRRVVPLQSQRFRSRVFVVSLRRVRGLRERQVRRAKQRER